MDFTFHNSFKFTICLQLLLSVFNKIKRCTRPLCAQVVKMWSWVFTVTVLLPSIKWAEAQGINNSLSSPNYHNSCNSSPHVSVYALKIFL